jgi:hypothetical protein
MTMSQQGRCFWRQVRQKLAKDLAADLMRNNREERDL